jgi:hypothetical protein
VRLQCLRDNSESRRKLILFRANPAQANGGGMGQQHHHQQAQQQQYLQQQHAQAAANQFLDPIALQQLAAANGFGFSNMPPQQQDQYSGYNDMSRMQVLSQIF